MGASKKASKRSVHYVSVSFFLLASWGLLLFVSCVIICHFRPEKLFFSRAPLTDIWQDPLTIVVLNTNYKDDMLADEWWSKMDNCPRQCRLVSPSQAEPEVPNAAAVVFHTVNGDLSQRGVETMMDRRDPRQLWVFYTMESPESLAPNLPHCFRRNFSRLDGLFNWTMTWRDDSDVRLHFLGHKNFVDVNDHQNTTDVDINDRTQPNRGKFWKTVGGKKHMAAMISNCNSWNYDRLAFIDELGQHGLEVDVEGACNPNSTCRKGSDACIENISQNYLFYAAFENSLCQGYTSEKFLRTFNYDLVPVVLGAGNYDELAPAGSFIDARRFDSAADLVAFLKEVAANETAYNSYFDWRAKYRLEEPQHRIFCKLCVKLHQHREGRTTISQVYNDFDGWFRQSKPCGGQKIFLGKTNENSTATHKLVHF